MLMRVMLTGMRRLDSSRRRRGEDRRPERELGARVRGHRYHQDERRGRVPRRRVVRRHPRARRARRHDSCT